MFHESSAVREDSWKSENLHTPVTYAGIDLSEFMANTEVMKGLCHNKYILCVQ